MRIALLTSVLLTAAASAQDPNPAWSYDPVAVGNARSYAQGLTPETTDYWRTDSPTSLTLDGERWTVRRTQRFFRLTGNTEGWGRTEKRVLVRYDTTEANVLVRAEDGSASPLYPCRLDVPLAPAGGRCGGGVPYTKTDDGRLVFQDRGNGFSTTLQAGIGVVAGTGDRSPGFELVGAVIDGTTLAEEPEAFPDSRIDPTPAARYAPLSAGNEWQYEVSNIVASPMLRYRRVQLSEGREIGGEQYVAVSQSVYTPGGAGWVGQADVTYVRFDTLSARIVGPDPQGVFGPIRSGACPFDEPSASSAEVYCEVNDQSPEAIAFRYEGTVAVQPGGVQTPLREYSYAGLADYYCGQGTFAAGIGYVGYECSGPAELNYERLIYARVRQPDGTVLEIGRQYAVSSDDTPAADPLALTVGPTTTAGPVTLRLAVAVGGAIQWRVFDALGRVVWQRDEVRAAGTAALALDASDWPAGLYIVRAETASGAATATVVRR